MCHSLNLYAGRHTNNSSRGFTVWSWDVERAKKALFPSNGRVAYGRIEGSPGIGRDLTKLNQFPFHWKRDSKCISQELLSRLIGISRMVLSMSRLHGPMSVSVLWRCLQNSAPKVRWTSRPSSYGSFSGGVMKVPPMNCSTATLHISIELNLEIGMKKDLM